MILDHKEDSIGTKSILMCRGQEDFSSGEVLTLMGAGVAELCGMVWCNLFALFQVMIDTAN